MKKLSWWYFHLELTGNISQALVPSAGRLPRNSRNTHTFAPSIHKQTLGLLSIPFFALFFRNCLCNAGRGWIPSFNLKILVHIFPKTTVGPSTLCYLLSLQAARCGSKQKAIKFKLFCIFHKTQYRLRCLRNKNHPVNNFPPSLQTSNHPRPPLSAPAMGNCFVFTSCNKEALSTLFELFLVASFTRPSAYIRTFLPTSFPLRAGVWKNVIESQLSWAWFESPPFHFST